MPKLTACVLPALATLSQSSASSDLAHPAQLRRSRQALNHPDMIRIPGGTFRMGSDQHYPEEAPAHRLTVARFWMDRAPVTNRQFRKFVDATGYVTLAEIAPDAKDYPGALPHMLNAGSLVFSPTDHPVDLRNFASAV